MSWVARTKERLTSWLGLDFEVDLDLGRKALSEIDAALYVGARPRPEGGVELLREQGITHVLSCLEEPKRKSVAFLDGEFETRFLPLRDSIHADIDAHIPAALEFAEGAWRGGAGAKLLVHCEVGVSRSATLATAMLMKREQLSFLDAYLRLRSKRPAVLPNIGFASSLQRLETELGVSTSDGQGVSSLARYLRDVCNAPVEVEMIEEALRRTEYDAPRALEAIFGDIPRVVQGARG